MKRPLSHVAHRLGCSDVMELLLSEQMHLVKDTPIFYQGEQVWLARQPDNTFTFLTFTGRGFNRLALTTERAGLLMITEKHFCDIVGDEYVINISNCKRFYEGCPQSEPKTNPGSSNSRDSITLMSLAAVAGLSGVFLGLERTGSFKTMFASGNN